MNGAPRIILDTDFGGDCDDVAAVAMLHVMADAGEVAVLGIVTSNPTWFGVPGLRSVNEYYGRGGVPVGALHPRLLEVPRPPIPAAAVDSTNVTGYAEVLARTGPVPAVDAGEPADAVQLYRQLLAERDDGSVTVVVIGGQTNLAALLCSGPDRHSGLSGHDLVAAKVRELHAMAGEFPSGREWNLRLDPGAARTVAVSWPTPIIYGGYELGAPILTGSRLFRETQPDNPVARAYEVHGEVGHGGSRPSWDQITTYVAVRGIGRLFELSRPGRLRVMTDGANGWSETPKGRHRHLRPSAPVTAISEAIEDLMVRSPRRGWH